MDDKPKEDFTTLCATSATEYNKKRLLVREAWTCSECSDMLKKDVYFSTDEGEDWVKKYETWI